MRTKRPGWLLLPLLVLAAAAHADSALQRSAFYATRIVSIEQLQGQPQWVSSQRGYLASSVWQFNPNGTFVFASPGSDLRTDLYPLVGRYVRQGNTLTFQAENAISYPPTSLAWTRMEGRLDLRAQTVAAAWFSGVANSARINNIPFNSQASSGYRFTLRVEPRR